MTFSHTGAALIIGGTSGMGLETAKQLSKHNIPKLPQGAGFRGLSAHSIQGEDL